MSYLGPLRIHFAGRFRATPSTVNNDPANYGLIQAGDGTTAGGFNPAGDSGWRLLGCRVSGVFLANGEEAPDDPVARYTVADADQRVSAKIVDLDPQQQLVSEIWGLELRLVGDDGHTALRGVVVPAAMSDLWQRDPTVNGDAGLSAAYQSVIRDLVWDDRKGSRVLSELQGASQGRNELSIKFNVDRYELRRRSRNFMTGRIVGTIGPAYPGEPRHFVRGRQFVAQAAPGSGPLFTPSNQLNSCPGVVDEQSRRVYLDLGNALPSSAAEREPAPKAFRLGCVPPGQPPADLCEIPVGDDDWYARTAGIVAVPSPDGEPLQDAQLAQVLAHPLEIVLPTIDGQEQTGAPTWGVAEAAAGNHVRADRFVYRLEPGDVAEADVYATRFGAPLAEASVIVYADPGQLQGPSSDAAASLDPGTPRVAYPPSALDYDRHLKIAPDGVARLTLRAGDPGGQRAGIDGQVFGLRPVLEESLSVGLGDAMKPGEFVSVLVWDRFDPPDPPTWYGTVEPIFRMYQRLYPVMDALVDLSSYDQVCANRELLLFAFSLPATDANSMPVSRDLSPAKRAAIVRWLGDLSEGGRPRVGIRHEPGSARGKPPRPGRGARGPDGKTAAAGFRGAARRGGAEASGTEGGH